MAGEVTVRHGRIGFWYRLGVVVIKPASLLLTKRDWRGSENIPRTGGVIVAVNHVSNLDPVTFAHFVYDAGRLPRYLAKSSLFTVPFLRSVLRGARQVPVHRGAPDAAVALSDAVEAIRGGDCVIIYPEGTVTRDPDEWPMRARTGVARLALMSGAPVVPVAQWGAQRILPYHKGRPRPLPRKTIHVLAGPPVDLSAYAGRGQDAVTLREITDVVMTRITEQLAELRGETPPAAPYDPRIAA